MKKGHVKLERALSKLGFCSRTEAARLIADGRVKVHGRVATSADQLVRPESAAIVVEGMKVVKSAARVIVLHKPSGVVTTRRDEQGRKTVYSVLSADAQSLMPVGRLDQATTGLLLFTNDTRLSAALLDPVRDVRKTYVVTVRGRVREADADCLLMGIEDDGETLRAERVEIRKVSDRETHLTLELSEGKNREIRRMMQALGHEVTRLKRIAFAGVELGTLSAGDSRDLSQDEIESLGRACGLR
jgi:23S rRNA pseudouridine2605 synthase